jgi:hypothetical protein
MTGDAAASRRPELPQRAARVGGWLRDSRADLLVIALVVGVGSGLGAVAFRYLIYFFTWLATGHAQFGHDGHVGSSHLPWLGLAFFVVIPVIGGLVYGPLIYRYAREARGHGVRLPCKPISRMSGTRPAEARNQICTPSCHTRRKPDRPGGGRVTLIDGILATAVLAGLVLNAALGWWWADPAAGYVLVFYAAREVREIFFTDH